MSDSIEAIVCVCMGMVLAVISALESLFIADALMHATFWSGFPERLLAAAFGFLFTVWTLAGIYLTVWGAVRLRR